MMTKMMALGLWNNLSLFLESECLMMILKHTSSAVPTLSGSLPCSPKEQSFQGLFSRGWLSKETEVLCGNLS